MTETKKMAFVFGDITLTLTPADIEAVYTAWELAHPGKTLRDMTSKEFSDAVMKRMVANAKPTRTVLHN
jgi:hypothetical protein